MSGIDFGLQYQFRAMESDFSLKWDTSYLDTFDISYEGSRSKQELAGTISNGEGGNGSYTEWRSYLTFAMEREHWGASYRMNYIGEADSQFKRIGATAPGVDDIVYHSIEANVRLMDGLTLRAGINNLLDEDPPYYTDPIDQNTDPFTYDLLGRRYFVSASYRF